MLQLYLPLFFRRIEIEGKSKVPQDGAILFAVNHQSTFLDAVLPLYRFDESGYFLMRSDLFNNKLLAAFFRKLHLLPIFRSQDGTDNIREKNLNSFRENAKLLKAGHPLLIFPEGTSIPEFKLKPLKKGVARMAVNFLQNEFKGEKLYIVPVALQYENQLKSGGRLWIKYLDAIPVHDHLKRASSLSILYREITTQIETQLSKSLLLDQEEKSVEAFFNSVPIPPGSDLETAKKLFNNFKDEASNRNAIHRPFWPWFLKILFLPTYLIAKLLNRAINDKTYQLSILAYSGMVLGFIQFLAMLIYFLK